MGHSRRIPAALLVFLAFQVSCSMPAVVEETSSSSTEPASSAAEPGDSQPAVDQDEAVQNPPIYVTVVLHIEDTPRYANCESYPDFRSKLIEFADAMAPYGVAVNMQTDIEFLVGVDRCETPAMQAETGGQNVLDYLVSRYGYEIDPHQQGGWDIDGQDNYSDIRFLLGQLTSAASDNVGGLVWDDPGQWQALAEGQAGLQNPGFTWNPAAVTLAVGTGHHLGEFGDDDITSGVWRPTGAGDDFWVHDATGPMVYIGPGEAVNWGRRSDLRTTTQFVNDLVAGLESGELDRELIYTATLPVPQRVVFNADERYLLQEMLDELAPLVNAGQVVYVTYSEVVQIWESVYDARPNIYREP